MRRKVFEPDMKDQMKFRFLWLLPCILQRQPSFGYRYQLITNPSRSIRQRTAEYRTSSSSIVLYHKVASPTWTVKHQVHIFMTVLVLMLMVHCHSFHKTSLGVFYDTVRIRWNYSSPGTILQAYHTFCKHPHWSRILRSHLLRH